ncbi:cytochrome P450, partial [Parachaetomium inaequale]
FLPERFLPGASTDAESPFKNDKMDALQPFSLGPRACLGQNLAWAELRLILAKVVWNFDLGLPRDSAKWLR